MPSVLLCYAMVWSLDCLIKGISKRNIHVPFWFISHGDRHGNKEANRKYFDVKCDNSQGMQKVTKK